MKNYFLIYMLTLLLYKKKFLANLHKTKIIKIKLKSRFDIKYKFLLRQKS